MEYKDAGFLHLKWRIGIYWVLHRQVFCIERVSLGYTIIITRTLYTKLVCQNSRHTYLIKPRNSRRGSMSFGEVDTSCGFRVS